MRRLAAAAAILVLGCTPAPPALTPDRLRSDINAEGAVPVVQRLWTSGEYGHVLDQIAAGQQAWIAISPALASGADAAASEGLGIALAHALPRNPAAVLSVLDSQRRSLSPDRVCGLPFIEGDISDISAYRRDATAAVTKVTDAGLGVRRAACLAALQRT
jgi:hypothetical protein